MKGTKEALLFRTSIWTLYGRLSFLENDVERKKQKYCKSSYFDRCKPVHFEQMSVSALKLIPDLRRLPSRVIHRIEPKPYLVIPKYSFRHNNKKTFPSQPPEDPLHEKASNSIKKNVFQSFPGISFAD